MATTYVAGKNMNYNMDGHYINSNMQKQQLPPRQITVLQGTILRYICTTKNASYQAIMRHTLRGRVTVLQSLESLVKRKFVEKSKVYPTREKSKLTFKPTQKGMVYSLAFLDTDYDEVIDAHVEAALMSEYNRRIKAVPDYYLRKKLMNHFSRFVFEDDYFTEEGRLKSTAQEDIINLGLRIGLLQLSSDKNFDFRNLFDPRTVDLVKNLYTVEEQRVLREVLVKIRQNLNTVIEQLPD
jgi:hypothetical protein